MQNQTLEWMAREVRGRDRGGTRTSVSNTRTPAKYKFMFILFCACTTVERSCNCAHLYSLYRLDVLGRNITEPEGCVVNE